MFCNYWIKVCDVQANNYILHVVCATFKAPEGSKIEVKLKSFPKGVSIDGCPYAGVEIKTHKDQLLTGYR